MIQMYNIKNGRLYVNIRVGKDKVFRVHAMKV